jgi:hypothetical protein
VMSNPGTDSASVGQATAQRPQSTQPDANSGPCDVATSAPVGQASVQRRQDVSGNRAGRQEPTRKARRADGPSALAGGICRRC